MNYKLLLLLLVIVSSCTVVSDMSDDVQSLDWTIFRCSPSLNGYTERTLPDSPTLLWSKSTKTRTVASPIVYNSIVYTLDRKGVLRAFDEQGDSSVVYDFKTPVEASFVVQDSIIYVGRIDGFVTALSIPRQKVVWEYETLGQISGSPNLIETDGQCYLTVGSYDSNMYALDARTGRLISQCETGYYINGTAAVWKQYTVFGGCDAWVRMMDMKTGTIADSLELDVYIPASPAIMGEYGYVCDYNGAVYELKLEGNRIASHRKIVEVDADHANESGGLVSMPAVTRDAVYVLTDERYVSCYERSTGQVRWKKMLRGIVGECSPFVCNDKVLVCTKDGHVSIFDTSSGNELWHYDAGEQIIASPAVVADRFYILTSRGTLLCFN